MKAQLHLNRDFARKKILAPGFEPMIFPLTSSRQDRELTRLILNKIVVGATTWAQFSSHIETSY